MAAMAAVGVVDPVTGELARAEDLEGRRAVGPDGEGEGRPDGGSAELQERRVLHPPGGGQAGATAGGLHEPDLGVGPFGIVLQVGEGDGLEGGAELGQAHGGGSHHAAARVAGVDDAPVLDLGPGGQPVGEAERPRRPHGLEVVDRVGGWIVVAREPGLEGPLQHRTGDRFRGDPRHRGDRQTRRASPPPARMTVAWESTPRPFAGRGGRPTGAEGVCTPGRGWSDHLVEERPEAWNGGSWATVASRCSSPTTT